MGECRWQDEWKTPALLIAVIAVAAALIVSTKKGDDSRTGTRPNDDPKIQMAEHYLDSLKNLLSNTNASIHNLSDSIQLHSVMLNSTDPAERERAQKAVDNDKDELYE